MLVILVRMENDCIWEHTVSYKATVVKWNFIWYFHCLCFVYYYRPNRVIQRMSRHLLVQGIQMQTYVLWLPSASYLLASQHLVGLSLSHVFVTVNLYRVGGLSSRSTLKPGGPLPLCGMGGHTKSYAAVSIALRVTEARRLLHGKTEVLEEDFGSQNCIKLCEDHTATQQSLINHDLDYVLYIKLPFTLSMLYDTVLCLRCTVFWDVTPSCPVEVHLRFGPAVLLATCLLCLPPF
jgi:hypothetical protein